MWGGQSEACPRRPTPIRVGTARSAPLPTLRQPVRHPLERHHPGIVERHRLFREHPRPPELGRLALEGDERLVEAPRAAASIAAGSSSPSVLRAAASSASSTVLSPSAPLPRAIIASRAAATRAGSSDHATSVLPLVRLAAAISAVAVQRAVGGGRRRAGRPWRSEERQAEIVGELRRPLGHLAPAAAMVMPRSPSPSWPSSALSSGAAAASAAAARRAAAARSATVEAHRRLSDSRRRSRRAPASSPSSSPSSLHERERRAGHLHRGGVAADERHDDRRRRPPRAARFAAR